MTIRMVNFQKARVIRSLHCNRGRQGDHVGRKINFYWEKLIIADPAQLSSCRLAPVVAWNWLSRRRPGAVEVLEFAPEAADQVRVLSEVT